MSSNRRVSRGEVATIGIALLLSAIALASRIDTPAPTATPIPVDFAPVEVTSLGDITQGTASQPVLVLQFIEADRAAIASGAGSLDVTLTDHAGLTSVEFIGVPGVFAPGSLGATAILTNGNVLRIAIVDSDSLNVESVTISGLGIRAPATAAIGPINAIVTGCEGSLAGCTPSNVLASPGKVVAP